MKRQSAGAAWHWDSRNTAERHPLRFMAASMSLQTAMCSTWGQSSDSRAC